METNKILQIKNVNKSFLVNGEKYYALKNINLAFNRTGLVMIVGKSGAGKSTLLNLISLVDKPDSGQIIYEKKNIFKYSNRQKVFYRNQKIGLIFQHYNLLDSQTVIYNVALPKMVAGWNKKDAYKEAETILESINFPRDKYHQRCSDLSGGQKQRVAICRSLINHPDILLCDEPTGALDFANAKITMDLIKQASKECLVIMVTHNEKLIDEYADEVVRIEDGRIKDHRVINRLFPKISQKKKKMKKGDKWSSNLISNNVKRRSSRNILSILSIIVSTAACMLVVGFQNGSENSVKQETLKRFDYGSLYLHKEVKNEIENSKLTLVKTLRPSKEEINVLRPKLDNYIIEHNIDSLLNSDIYLSIGEERVENLTLAPVYEFNNNYVDNSLLIEGRLPINEDKEIVINKAAYDYLKSLLNYSPLGIKINQKSHYEYEKYVDEFHEVSTTDYFVFDSDYLICGVVDELNYLSTPKLFYSYSALLQKIVEMPLPNYSMKSNSEYSWYEAIMDADNDSLLSSYNYRLFLKDYHLVNQIGEDIERIEEPYVLTSEGELISSSLLELIKASQIALDVFLLITIVGAILIVGIISYSSYLDDKKTSAILTCLGVRKSQIIDIYAIESLFIGLISLSLTFLITPFAEKLINYLVKITLGFVEMVKIPFFSWLNYPFLFPLVIIVASFLVIVLSTYLPISLSKAISIREELLDE